MVTVHMVTISGMRKPGLRIYIKYTYVFILQYVSPLLFKILEICNPHKISYESCIANRYKFYYTPTIKHYRLHTIDYLRINLFKFEIQNVGKFLMPGHKLVLFCYMVIKCYTYVGKTNEK